MLKGVIIGSCIARVFAHGSLGEAWVGQDSGQQPVNALDQFETSFSLFSLVEKRKVHKRILRDVMLSKGFQLPYRKDGAKSKKSGHGNPLKCPTKTFQDLLYC